MQNLSNTYSASVIHLGEHVTQLHSESVALHKRSKSCPAVAAVFSATLDRSVRACVRSGVVPERVVSSGWGAAPCHHRRWRWWGALPDAKEQDIDDNPTCDAAELAEAGDVEGARELLMDVLLRDLRCIDAHAHLGNLEFDRRWGPCRSMRAASR